MGSRTDAALAQVVAARADAEEQFDRLEAAGRAAIDIPARIRRSPAKAAGIAAGGAFVALGGPKRLFRRAKKAVTGKEEELPSELLPKDVEKALKKLGTDGKKVRGTLEREFAKYLDEHAEARNNRDLGAVTALLLASIAKPTASRAGRELAQRLFDADAGTFREQLEKVRRRQAGRVAA